LLFVVVTAKMPYNQDISHFRYNDTQCLPFLKIIDIVIVILHLMKQTRRFGLFN